MYVGTLFTRRAVIFAISLRLILACGNPAPMALLAANNNHGAGSQTPQGVTEVKGVLLFLQVQPVSAIPGEPIAVYATLTNQNKTPTMVRNHLDRLQGGLALLARSRDTLMAFPPQQTLSALDPTPDLALEPGESLRWKTWLVYTEFSASPADEEGAFKRHELSFPFRDPGLYEVQGFTQWYGFQSGQVKRFNVRAVPATLTIQQPNKREEAALTSLMKPLSTTRPNVGHGLLHLSSVPIELEGGLANGLLTLPSGGVLEELGEGSSTPAMQRFREIYENFPDTRYAWYAALALAAWETQEIDSPDWKKPARFGRAAEILASLEKQPLSPALREEVLALQAQVYLILGHEGAAELRLKKLEALDPAEPLKSLIPQIRRLKTILPPPRQDLQ